MLSADIFNLIENLLSAATSFFYSTLFAWIILLRYPRSAPRLLYRRFKNSDVKQVGPLTLHFLSFGLSCGLVIISVGLYLGDVIRTIEDDANRDLMVEMFSCCLIGTLVVDLAARCIVGFGWPTFKHSGIVLFSRREKLRIRRIIACYSLVIPVLSANCAVIAILCLFNFLELGTASIVESFAPAAIVLVLVAATSSARIVGSSFVSRLRVSGDNRLLKWMYRETFFPMTIGACAISMFFTVRIIAKEYPQLRPVAQLARSDSLKVVKASCHLLADRVTFSITLFNSSNTPGVVYIDVDSGVYEAFRAEADMTVKNPYVIAANSVVRIDLGSGLDDPSATADAQAQKCPIHVRNIGDGTEVGSDVQDRL